MAPHHPGTFLHEQTDGISVRRFRYFLPENAQVLCYGNGIPENLKRSLLARFQLPFLVIMFIVHAIVNTRDCDVIHAHWSIAGLAGLIASRIWRIPVILNMHHGTTRDLSRLEKFIIEHVDYVICNSTFTLEHIQKTATPKKTRVVPPGVDTVAFQRQSEDIMDKCTLVGVQADCPLIFTMGRLIEWKGHRYLIEALRLLDEHDKCHLLIGGEGLLRQELSQQVNEAGLNKKVTFLGHVPNHLAPLYYSLSDIYIQPSIIDRDGNTEGLGVTLLEAMACETPCIGSRVGGITDIITHGKNGFLVNPADPAQLAGSITTLLRDKELRMYMGKEGRQLVEQNYSWHAKAKETIELYERLTR